MKDEKESKTKKLGRFLGKKAVEAGNIINQEIQKAGKIAKDEFKDFDITNVIVEPIKKPKNESRIEFTRRARPTKTYTQANRTVQFFSRNPDEREMNPGIDGLVSFSILIAPFAVLLGFLILFTDFNEILAIMLFLIYLLLVAIPGAYLGLDSILAGARSVIMGGTTTFIAIIRGIFEFFYLLIRGFAELFIIIFNNLFGFLKGAFDTFADYLVFTIVYIISAGAIWLFLSTIQLETTSIIVLGFIVLLPALLPASVAHRFWMLWKLDKRDS